MENSEDQATVEEIAENQTEDTDETEAVNNEGAVESGLLESEEPMEEGAQLNDNLLEETEAQESSATEAVAAQPAGEVEGTEAVLEATMDDVKAEEKEEEEDKEEEIRLPDTEMPQVNVASLAKRKWQVKIYPLKPDDFVNGQIARVFSNAKESLLYIYSSGRFNGGKGEMYVSSAVQAAKVVHNLMKLDLKSQNINIEIIRKNNEGVVEEKAFMRFDTKLIRILCVPVFKSRKPGGRRDRVVGSVFLKNVPNGTSKDMLRVMFPFAPEINYSPEKFPDGTARLVLGARSSVGPCLRGFTKIELGDALLEIKPLQKRPTDEKSQNAGETDGTKKVEAGEAAGSQSEADGKGVEGKTDEKSTSGKSPAKSPAASKAAEGKEPQKKPQAGKPGVGNKTPQSQTANRNRNPRDIRRDTGGIRRGSYRPRGSNFVQRGIDRNRFRTGGFGSRFRPEDRRMRMPGDGRDVGIDTGAAKEMILLQSQLSMAIKNQLTMLNQTQFALEQAKREAATVSFTRDVPQASFPRDVPQASPSSLMSRRVTSTPRTESARGGQAKTNNRRPQNRRGKPRDRRTEGGRFAEGTRNFGQGTRSFGEGARFGGGGDYSYKRNAEMAGLPEEYGVVGQGKRRTSGFGEHTESHSWADDRAAPAFGSSYPPTFGGGYEREFEDREADFHNLHTTGLSPRNLNYSHNNSNYGYRY